MAKKKNRQIQRQGVETGQDDGEPRSQGFWSPRARFIVSVLIILHFAAVISAPLAIPQPSSRLARLVEGYLSPYTSLLYLRHGYRFFAPDPGPSHLLIFEVACEDGTIIKGRFPDSAIHQPRLMYHRFFMVGEHFWNLGIIQDGPLFDQNEIDNIKNAANLLTENGFGRQADWLLSSIPESMSEILSQDRIDQAFVDLTNEGKHVTARNMRDNMIRDREELAMARRHRDAWLSGIANFLLKRFDGVSVRIWIQEHSISDFDHVLDGGKLTDLSTYQPRQLVYSDDEEIQ
jgi:hypothetical protein